MQTVDQFLELKVPMRSSELSSLFRGVDNAFQVYANHVIDKLGMRYILIVRITFGKKQRVKLQSLEFSEVQQISW